MTNAVSKNPDGSALFRRTAISLALTLAIVGAGSSVLLAEPANAPVQSTPSAAVVQPVMPSFADVAERVSPAVVNVTVESVSMTPKISIPGHPDLEDGAPMQEFFRHFFEQPGSPAPRRAQGAGSGFFIDAEGLVVTNHHVIDGADEVTVTLNDGTQYEAKVLGRDDKTDLALLKIDAKTPTPYVDLGDSTTTRVGDWVLAVGNPFGLGGTVNAGIVSARGRDINSGPYDDYIQIDAPINRGNSGGPLFDVYGRVIGVNTAIFSPTGGNVGIGFAIPAETVRDIVADLKEFGHVERGWLGVQIQPVTEELAAGLGLDGTDGVLVADILPDGPAQGSDLQAGDVIVTAGGQTMKDYKDLPKLIASTKAGTRMDLAIIRDGKPRTVQISIGHMPDENPLASREKAPSPEDAKGRLGLYLSPLTPEVRREQRIEAETGVFVVRVEPGSPAAAAGIESGNIITMVGGERVDDPDQVVAAVRAAVKEERAAVVLRVEKEGKPLFVAVPFAG
jgi:serine protease Do